MSLIEQKVRWHVSGSAAELCDRAAGEILRAAEEAIAERGAFHLALAGGSTPRAVYEKLREATAEWPLWNIYFGDERCLPPNHPERNSRMALDAWLREGTVPHSQIYIIPAERGALQAAQAYSAMLAGVTFDLVLLGLGEDGHTASLFPGHDCGVGADAPPVLAVHDAPKPPPERVSLSAQRLSDARKVMFLVTGEGKRAAVAAWRRGEPIPASMVAPLGGVDVLVENVCLSGQ